MAATRSSSRTRRSRRRCRRSTPTRSSTRATRRCRPLAKPLVEPLRITLEPFDLEALSKLWTATTQPLRLSVGYEVSLVVVDSAVAHTAGPPVGERRVVVTPSLGPRLHSVEPARGSFGDVLLVAVEGLTAGATFTLARETARPAGAGVGTGR